MKHTKMMAFAAAFIMLAVGFMVFAGFMSDADDDPVQVNDTTVNVYFDGSGTWTKGSYEVFDLFQALQAACGSDYQGLYFTTTESDWTETTTLNGTYPNPDYGTIRKNTDTVGYVVYDDIMGEDILVDSTQSFSIYGRNPGDSDWTDITSYALGWIRPFTDYYYHAEFVYNNNIVAGVNAFANIAVKMKSTSSLADITNTPSLLPLKSLTDPETRTDCQYTFYIKDTTGTLYSHIPSGAEFWARLSPGANATKLELSQELFSNGFTIYGYGSDAYRALFNATNGAVVAQERTWTYNSQYNYYTNYSWMSHMFGVGTETSPAPGGGTIYDYWASYKATSGGTAGEYLSFNLGYHTNVPGSYSHTFPGDPDYTYNCNGYSYVIQYERSYPPTN